MPNLEDRAHGEEQKYAHNEELAFKINARLNKLLGLWAAGKLGKTAADAESYAKDMVLADIEGGHDAAMQKLLQDFAKAGINIAPSAILAEIEHLRPIAKEQITGAAI